MNRRCEIFASRIDELVEPFEGRTLDGAVSMFFIAAFIACFAFGDLVAGLIGGGAGAIALQMCITGWRERPRRSRSVLIDTRALRQYIETSSSFSQPKDGDT